MPRLLSTEGHSSAGPGVSPKTRAGGRVTWGRGGVDGYSTAHTQQPRKGSPGKSAGTLQGTAWGPQHPDARQGLKRTGVSPEHQGRTHHITLPRRLNRTRAPPTAWCCWPPGHTMCHLCVSVPSTCCSRRPAPSHSRPETREHSLFKALPDCNLLII